MRHLVTGGRGRWLTLAALVAVLAIAGIQVSDPNSYLSEIAARIGDTTSGPQASLADLTSIDQLQASFNRDSGRPRLILLLSPT